MKTSKLFLALALPVAFTACTNDDFSEVNGQQGADARLVELGENFVLGVQGVDGTQTKGIWEAGQNGAFNWSWIPEILADATGANSMLGASLNVNADEIGLCWTGELTDGTGSIGQRVYTNYQFIHDGWLAKGQATADFDPCNYTLENGKRYADITVSSIDHSSTLADIKGKLTGTDNNVTIGTTPTALDLNTGVFKTENKAIFGGSYVVYYPYDDTFKDAGYVPASAEVNLTDVMTSKPNTAGSGPSNEVPATAVLSERSIAENTFLVGYANNLVGGSEASKLSLNPLSGIISLQLVSATTGGATKTITKVALYSKDGFVKSVGLDASKIKSMGAAGGEALYVEGSKKTTSTIVSSIAAASQQALSSTKQIMFIPALPTTAKDLEVILFANDNSIARIAMNEDLTIAPAAGKSVVVTVKESDFSANTLVAVDSESLEEALGTSDTKSALTTIEVIGDITLEDDLTVYNNTVIKGDGIIVPEGKTLTLNAAAAGKAPATILSKVTVEGKGCCGTADGKITANGGVLTDVDNYGEISVAGALTVNGTLKNLVDAEDTNNTTNEATLTIADNAGDLTLVGTLENEAVVTNKEDFTMNPNSKIVNNGTITNEGMFFNNSTRANFENHDTYVDKLGYLLSGQLLTNVGEKAEYICEVDADETRLNYALVQRSMVTTVRFVKGDWYDFSPFEGKDFSNLKFEVAAESKVGFYGSIEAKNGTTTVYNPLELKIKSLTVNSDLRINRDEEGNGIDENNNKLELNVVEDVTVAAGATFSIEQPVLATIGESLNINGTYTPLKGTKVQVGDRTAEDGMMYIGATGVATIAPNVQMNVYGTVDKAVQGKFSYTTATGTEVSGEVRCKSYNTSAGWTAGQAPVVDAYFTFN